MPSLESDPFFWIAKIIGCAVSLQGLELLQIHRTFAADGIWRWESLRKEFEIFPRIVQSYLNLLLDYPRFLGIILAQIACGIALLSIPQPPAALFIALLMTTGLISLRWRGTFNGGADYMTILVLLMLSIATLFRASATVQLGCLWYLAVQAILSYFMSGAVKMRSTDWWSGRALQRFMSSPPYDPPAFFVALSKRPFLMRMGSWTILVFEISFPLALTGPRACAAFLCAALAFHILNFATFGLNRFIFAWSAAYPALYYCSTRGIFA